MRKVLFLVLLILSLAACSTVKTAEISEKSKTGSESEVRVEVVPAEVRETEKAIWVTGSLFPDDTVTVSSEVTGKIARIGADFGQGVRAGQVILEFDRQELSLQLERTKSSLAQAMARIGLQPGQEGAMPDSTPAIRQATASLEDARYKYERAESLYKTGDVSQERQLELEKLYRARQAALEAAQDDLRTQLAAVRALRAEVKLAEKRLNDGIVRAPFDGAIAGRLVAVGQYVRESTALFTLVKSHPLRLRVDIPENAAAGVKIGTALSFETETVPGRRFDAVVRELNPGFDSRSRALTAEARTTQPYPELRPGTFVRVRLVVAPRVEIVVVPERAVHRVAGLSKIFVIRNGKAVETRIPPGTEIDGWLEVPAVLVRAGEPIAVKEIATLVDGTPVQVATAEVKR